MASTNCTAYSGTVRTVRLLAVEADDDENAPGKTKFVTENQKRDRRRLPKEPAVTLRKGMYVSIKALTALSCRMSSILRVGPHRGMYLPQEKCGRISGCTCECTHLRPCATNVRVIDSRHTAVHKGPHPLLRGPLERDAVNWAASDVDEKERDGDDP
jgi:hypothetical protein